MAIRRITLRSIDPTLKLGEYNDGGDAEGKNRLLGNNDNFALGIETNNVTRFNITADGMPQITGGMQSNYDTITGNLTLDSSDYNILSCGPITVNSGVEIIIEPGTEWTVI